MVRLTYRQEALDDLDEIAALTLQRWGRAQTRRYVRQTRAACRRLVTYPLLGTTCDHLRLGLRRTARGSHFIFYRQTAGGNPRRSHPTQSHAANPAHPGED